MSKFSSSRHNSTLKEYAVQKNDIPSDIDVLPLNYDAQNLSNSLSDSIMHDTSSVTHVTRTENHFQKFMIR